MDAFPGRYRVTLTGSGFDHSYIYARYGLINQETYKLDIDFTGIDPNEMTFEFTATEMLHYWHTAVHTLDDANVTVNSVTVEKVGKPVRFSHLAVYRFHKQKPAQSSAGRFYYNAAKSRTQPFWQHSRAARKSAYGSAPSCRGHGRSRSRRPRPCRRRRSEDPR